MVGDVAADLRCQRAQHAPEEEILALEGAKTLSRAILALVVPVAISSVRRVRGLGEED